MNKKLLLIINPVAGKMKSKTSLYDIINVFDSNGFDVTVKLTARRGHATEIVVSEHKNYDILVCAGGDGTLNEVVKGLLIADSYVPIGYIPAGSTNDFANSIGLSSNIKQAAENIAKGQAEKLDVGAFKESYFTYIASFGAFTSASYSTPQSTKNAIGHIAYILEGIKDLSTIKPVYIKVEANGETYEDDYIFGGIANSTSVGGIVKLKKEMVDMSDGFFEVILIKNPKNINHLNDIIKSLLTSEYKNNKSIDYFNAANIRITTEDKVPFTVDGEYADGSGSFTVRNLKQRLTIIK